MISLKDRIEKLKNISNEISVHRNLFLIQESADILHIMEDIENEVENSISIKNLSFKDFNFLPFSLMNIESSISGIINLYLKIYISKYGYDNTLSFINSRKMWENKSFENFNFLEFSKEIKLTLSSINISMNELYINEIKNETNTLFSKFPLKQLFILNNMNNDINNIINRKDNL